MAAVDGSQEPVRPTTDTSGAVGVRFTVAEAEALSDGLYGPLADEWPDAWIGHQQAHSAALVAVEAALDGRADVALQVLFYVGDVIDNMIHHAMLERSRGAAAVAVGKVLHQLDGCAHGRRHDPVNATPGQYRTRRPPLYLDQDQASRWIEAGDGRRRRCRRCWP